MQYLKWIPDEHLFKSVEKLLNIAKHSLEKTENHFDKNVLDPFSALFQISGFGISHDEWLIAEKTRQAQKSLQNHVGDFHQVILGGVEGWDNLGTGQIMDLICEEKKFVAEIKNKYNTVKGSDQSGLYKVMDNLVAHKSSSYKGYTAYYVTIIPKNPKRNNVPFTPSDKEKGSRFPVNELIRIIDGASFYELVTGDPNALFDLYKVLPKVIYKISGTDLPTPTQNFLVGYFKKAYGQV